MKPEVTQIRILYLFAGLQRQADMGDCFRKLAASSDYPGVQLHVEELDILRGGQNHDLLEGSRQREIIQGIRSGRYDLVRAAPHCNTFSRAVFGDD